VNEAVDRLIAERQRMDAGLPGTLLVSMVGHLLLVGMAIALPALLPRPSPLRIADGFAVVLPRGGGGTPVVRAPEPAPPARPAPVASAALPPAPAGRKPHAREVQPDALPAPDARPRRRKTEPQVVGRPAKPAATASPAAAASATPGVEFGAPGPGVPDGTDSGGDWYLAGVQQKIWMIWNQQIKVGFTRPIGVTFTILPDGSVTDVKVTQPSGVTLLDMAAARAVLNAAPFGPLPRENGQNPRTIQALFRPTS
jgi:TonB family protein